jgi:hypothetical protein
VRASAVLLSAADHYVRQFVSAAPVFFKMRDRRYVAMQKAVDLARSGRCSNWWSVQARMLVSGCEAADLEWTDAQRAWLDRLCAEARATAPVAGGPIPAAECSRADPDGGNT